MNTLKRLLPLTLCLLTVGAAHADLIKSGAAYNRTVLITSSTDHISGATGLTAFTVTLSKAGGAVATITPTVTEIGGGRYSVALVTGNTGTLGALDMTITATGADPTDSHDQVVAFDPNTDLGAATLATVNTTTGTINTTTTSTNALATGINTQTAKIGTNAMDSPNEVTSQGNAGTILTQTTAANQQSNAIAGMTTQGYTTARAPKLDNADVATSSRMATFTYTAPPTLPGDYLSAAEIAKLAYLDAAISSRSTYAGGAVASVTGAVGSVTAAVTLPTTAPTGYGGSTGDTSGVTTLLARLGSPVGATLAADVAAVKADTGGLTTSVAALPASTVAALFGSSFITIPGSHTTTGTGEVLTYKQVQSLSDAVLGGDNTSTVPAASGTATVTYYLRGQPKVAGNVVAVSTVTYDASKNQIGRVVLVAQPYPSF